MEELTVRETTLGWLIGQAQERVRAEVLEVLKQSFEGLVEGLRDEVVGRGRYGRCGCGKLYRYGYRLRKFVETSWGTIYGVRIPRVRDARGEVGLLRRYEPRLWKVAGELVMGFGQGMSLRSLSIWLRSLGFPTGCASSLGKVIEKKVLELKERRGGPIDPRRFVALVVDGVWFTRRKGSRGVWLVAIGVRVDGGFEVLDWEVSGGESSRAYERLLDRLYHRGLEQVELVVGDEAGGIWEALDVVYPFARRQVCLWHLEKILEGMLRDKGFWNRREFRRAYWRIFDVEELEEAQMRLEAFLIEWQQEPEVLRALRAREHRLFQYISLPYWWNYRVRTTNLGENFFKHLRIFLRRFPGLKDDEHANYVMATYLLSLEKKTTTGRTTPYQLQLNFNTGG